MTAGLQVQALKREAPLRCSSCQHENREGRRFCVQCGGSLALVCSACGEALEPDDRFCGECGEVIGAIPAATHTHAASSSSSGAPGSTVADLPSSFAAVRYRIECFLGEGAKKRVYLAHDTRLDRKVALALIKTEGLDEAGRARIQREAQSMAQLGDHPNIVPVFDIGEDAGQVYIVSQFMAGDSREVALKGIAESQTVVNVLWQ